MTPIVLKIYEDGKLIGTRAFKADRVKIGSAGADCTLAFPGVDPEHAVIVSRQSGLVLQASGESPLFLNGQPIIAAPLRNGDVITIGELRVQVEVAASAPAAAKPVIAPVPAAPARNSPHLHLVPGTSGGVVAAQPAPLSVVRDSGAAPAAAAAVAVAVDPMPPPPPPPQPPPVAAAKPYASLPKAVVQGGECAEVELFWGDTRVSVWQLLPGEAFTAGSAAGCHALFADLDKALVLKSDANGWTVNAPRPLNLFLEEEGKVIAGPELLVRGRSSADKNGLVVPLPSRACAILANGNLALRIRRVMAVQRVAGETNDYRGVFAAAVASVLMMLGMKYWSSSLPPTKLAEPELITPRPVAFHADPPKPPNDAPATPKKEATQNEGRRDPGKAVARHMGEEGQAGSRTAPRRDARAQRKTDDRAVALNSGLLAALGGKGSSNSFGVALEKGTVDAMGHLTGPKVADARGDEGMGLKSLGGRGGGGDGSGLGLARIGTNGIGGGLANYGDGKGGLRGKENGDIGLGPGKPEVVGSIDPELIRKVVHDHRAQIRTCYETQLTSRPNLAGKIIAAWTIDQSGSVTESKTQETTMHDHSVEDCVTSKIKTWRFPIPKGGGEVFVTYPFLFTPGG